MSDLQAAHEYAAVSSAAHANRLVDRLIKRTAILENFLEAGRMVPEFSNLRLRELPEHTFRIVYRIISPERIDILRIHPAASPLDATALLA